MRKQISIMHTSSLPEVTLRCVANHPNPQHKKKSVEWARKLMQRNDWVLLDTETTGVNSSAEVIQVGVLSSSGEVLFDSLVKPVKAKSIPSQAAAVHGITMEQLADAPTMLEILPKLRKLLEGKTTIMYNSGFDTRLLKQSINDNGKSLNLRTECAMQQYSVFAGDWREDTGDYKWQRLPGAAHGAIEDCKATLAVIRKMAESH